MQHGYPRATRYAVEITISRRGTDIRGLHASRTSAKRLHGIWIEQATQSDVPATKQVGRTFAKTKPMILNGFESKISKGILQGLHSVLQDTKNKASGYRNLENLFTMSYLLHGKLKPFPP